MVAAGTGKLRDDLRELSCQVDAATRLQPYRGARDERDDAIAVELGLEEPVGVRARGLASHGQHRGQRVRHDFGDPVRRQPCGLEPARRFTGREVIERDAREDGSVLESHVLSWLQSRPCA